MHGCYALTTQHPQRPRLLGAASATSARLVTGRSGLARIVFQGEVQPASIARRIMSARQQGAWRIRWGVVGRGAVKPQPGVSLRLRGEGHHLRGDSHPSRGGALRRREAICTQSASRGAPICPRPRGRRRSPAARGRARAWCTWAHPPAHPLPLLAGWLPCSRSSSSVAAGVLRRHRRSVVSGLQPKPMMTACAAMITKNSEPSPARWTWSPSPSAFRQ